MAEVGSKQRPFLLAIDQGGHASRASIFDPKGVLVAHALCKIDTKRPAEDRVEHDPDVLIDSLIRCISDVLYEWGEASEPLVAALATQRSSIVCWHRSTGHLLSPVISWQDTRASSELAAFELDTGEVHRRTGLFPSAHYGASKLRWCLDHLPEVAEAAAEGRLAFGPLSSFIAMRLTREKYYLADPANASRTLLWNINRQCWDDDLCRRFGIPISALPRVVPSVYDFGMLEAFSRPIPLILVTGDQSAALFGAGWPRAEALYLNMGTGAFLQRVCSSLSEKPEPSPSDRLLSSIVYRDEADCVYTLEGTVNGAASALHQFGADYDASEWPEMTEAWLNESSNPPLYLNAVGGLASPYWQPHFKSRFIGGGNKANRFTAVLESILFLIQRNIDEMARTMVSPREVIVSGGLAQWDGLCQRLANLCQVTVLRNAEHEGTSRGLANLLMKPAVQTDNFEKGQYFAPQSSPKLRARYHLWQREMQNAIDALESSSKPGKL